MDQELKQYLDAMEARIDTRSDAKFTALEDHLMEAMRDMQSELLRGFASYSTSMTIRVRKLEVDQSNLDAALAGRMDSLERRLGEIEQRLHIH